MDSSKCGMSRSPHNFPGVRSDACSISGVDRRQSAVERRARGECGCPRRAGGSVLARWRRIPVEVLRHEATQLSRGGREEWRHAQAIWPRRWLGPSAHFRATWWECWGAIGRGQRGSRPSWLSESLRAGRCGRSAAQPEPPNGLEFRCPVARALFQSLYGNSAGSTSSNSPHASRVSCSESLGGAVDRATPRQRPS